MALVKKNNNFDEIRKNIESNENMRVQMILLLMEIKPYRRSIFTQIHNSKHEIHKLWGKMEFEEKIEWIKLNMFTKWSKTEFVEHIITSIKTLRFNKTINQGFETIFEVYSK